MWCRPGRSRFRPRFVGVGGVWNDFRNVDGALSSSGASECPPPHWLAYILPGCRWLYELHSQSTISQCESDYCHTIMRGCVDPREEIGHRPRFVSISETGMGLYPPVVALPLCPSPIQSAASQYGWGSTPCGAVSTREVIVIVPAFLELERFGRFMNRGWDPIFPVCDGNAPHGVYSPRTALRSSNNQRIAEGIWVSSPCGAVSTRESSVLFPDWSKF